MSRRGGLLVIVVIATALYLPSLRNGFAYDDVALVERDPRVHSLGNLPALLTQPYWADEELGLYRPLVSSSYAVDWSLGGGSPAWFHATNTVWNAFACGALFMLLTAFVSVAFAMAGALLFAVHPVHVEAVANVVGRAELMAAAFSFTFLLLWLKSVRTRAVAGALVVLFALALLCKESAIMVPALALLIDVGQRKLTPATARAWLRGNGGILVLLLVIGAGYLVLRTAVLGDVGPSRVDPALEIGTPLQQRLTALQSWPVVLRLLLVPAELLADYGPRILMPAVSITPAVALGALLLVAAVVGGLLAWLRGHGRLALILLWVPLALLPVSNLLVPIGVLVAERALYLPSAAVAFAVTFTLAALPATGTRRVALVAAYVVGAVFAGRSLVRIPEWKTTDTILLALLQDRPESFRANWHNARLARAAGSPAPALARYGHAIELWPHRRHLVLEAAQYAAVSGDLAYARRLTGYMRERWPGDLEAARLYAGVTLDLADTTAARHALDDALAIHPADSLLLRMRAAITPDSAS